MKTKEATMSEREFKVGDRVKWAGLNGVVIRIISDSENPVIVEFENERMDSFTSDGREYTWLKKPSLKHRNFKPKAKLREVWITPHPDGTVSSVNDFEVVGLIPGFKCILFREVRRK